MRDSNRINDICDKLAAIWHTVPDWRLGQLIINFASRWENSNTGLFYIEDDDFINLLYKYVKEIAGEKEN